MNPGPLAPQAKSLTTRPLLLPTSMYVYYIIFIKTETIVVDKIGRNIGSQLLAHTPTYFYIKLSYMHDAMTCNIVANLIAVQY